MSWTAGAVVGKSFGERGKDKERKEGEKWS